MHEDPMIGQEWISFAQSFQNANGSAKMECSQADGLEPVYLEGAFASGSLPPRADC
jgi:hypothetical protein